MNAARLLQHFERISEAPDAVPRLRRFILDLAVRGKLVEQDPGDEPASELLKRIRAEKARLVKARQIGKQKPLSLVTVDEAPFSIPGSWEWSQIAEVGFVSPRNVADDKTPTSFVPMAMISSDYGVTHGHEVRSWGEIKSGFTHFAEGDVALAKITPCFENGKSAVLRRLTGGIGAGTTELHVVRPVLCSPEYVVIFLKSAHFIEAGIPRMTGTAGQKRVPAEYFAYAPFPLPPLAEQHRIVAKVDELMVLCDRLEAAQAERESRRDRVVAASLHRLNNGVDSESFREHARFHLRHLPRITTRPEHIQQLRQTILNLVVRGKLVPQDPNHEPASELLKRIQAEKERLVEEGKIKKQQPLPPTAKVDASFQLPPGWLLTQIQEIFISITDGDHLPPPKTQGGIPFLVIGNVRSQSIDFVGCRHVSEEYYNSLDPIRRPAKGDILYTLVGSYGIPILITDDRAFCVQRHIGILRPSRHVDAQFLTLALESRLVFDQAKECATGIAQKTVPLSGLRRIRIPLPPFAEQRHIVTKVDKLMVLCDRLESQLTNTQTETRRLLESTLHKAIAS